LNQLNAQIPGAEIGSFDKFYDIGTPAIAGTALYSESSQTNTVSGSGQNI